MKKTLENIAGGVKKVGKGISKKAAIGALALASVVGINADAKGEVISYDFTGFRQLNADRNPPSKMGLNNNGFEYTVNGLIPDVMTSIGFGKGDYFVGGADNGGWEYSGWESILGGSYNTNTSTTNPADDPINLVLGEHPQWAMFAIDLNGDGNFGLVYESNDNGVISIAIDTDEHEIITGTNNFYIGGEMGGVWNLPKNEISGNSTIPNLNVSVEKLYKMRGDANFDNVVNELDLAILQENMGNITEGARWRDGDFNEDGLVNSEDMDIFNYNIGKSAPYTHLSEAINDYNKYGTMVYGVVPEPSTLGVLGLGGLAFAGRRKRK